MSVYESFIDLASEEGSADSVLNIVNSLAIVIDTIRIIWES